MASGRAAGTLQLPREDYRTTAPQHIRKCHQTPAQSQTSKRAVCLNSKQSFKESADVYLANPQQVPLFHEEPWKKYARQGF